MNRFKNNLNKVFKKKSTQMNQNDLVGLFLKHNGTTNNVRFFKHSTDFQTNFQVNLKPDMICGKPNFHSLRSLSNEYKTNLPQDENSAQNSIPTELEDSFKIFCGVQQCATKEDLLKIIFDNEQTRNEVSIKLLIKLQNNKIDNFQIQTPSQSEEEPMDIEGNVSQFLCEE